MASSREEAHDPKWTLASPVLIALGLDQTAREALRIAGEGVGHADQVGGVLLQPVVVQDEFELTTAKLPAVAQILIIGWIASRSIGHLSELPLQLRDGVGQVGVDVDVKELAGSHLIGADRKLR